MKNIPILQTERLTIRPVATDDLDAMHQVLDGSRVNDPFNEPSSLDGRREWLEWIVMAMKIGEKYHMPTYVERAVVLRASNTLIGAVGYVDELEPFESLPYLGGKEDALCTPEISLYWEIGRPFRRQGYATEAAQALVDYAFKVARVKRLFALTHPDNLASLGVMRKLGMYIERAQGACGILVNPLAR